MTDVTPRARYPFGFVLFTMAALAVTLFLGMLQLKRATWEEAMYRMYEDALARPTVALPADASGQWQRPFQRVIMEGRFVAGQSVLVLAARGLEVPGYRLVTVLETAGSRPILVDRGWLPPDATLEGADATTEEQVLIGLIRPVEPRDLFMPDNEPEENVWRRIDPHQIAAYFGLSDIAPHYLQLGPETSAPAATARPGHPPPRVSERHTAVAYGWFSVAGGVVLVFLYRMRGLRRRGDNGEDAR